MVETDPLKARLLQELAHRSSPTARHVAAQRRLALLGTGLWLVLGTAAIGIRLGPRSFDSVLVELTVWLLAASLATGLILRSGGSALGYPRPWLLATALAIPPFLIAGLLLLDPFRLFCAPVSPKAHLGCLLTGLGLALGPLLGLLAARWRAVPTRPGYTGACIGAAAGSWAGLAMSLHCSVSEPLHLLVAHIAPVALLGLVGAIAGAAGLAPRMTPR